MTKNQTTEELIFEKITEPDQDLFRAQWLWIAQQTLVQSYPFSTEADPGFGLIDKSETHVIIM